MSGTIQASVVKDSASATNNLTLDTSGNVTVGNNLTVTGATTLAGNPTATGTVVMGSSFLRNRVINGGMVIDQRNSGASITPTTSVYTLDRWYAQMNQASKFSVQQNAGSVTTPTGFTNYIGITSTSSYSLLSADYFVLDHRIEGYNFSDFGFGTSNAKPFTISFWVYASQTGTYGLTFYNSAQTRGYNNSYTVNAINTWQYVTLTVPGDTSGVWNTTNGYGIGVRFSLGAGSGNQVPASSSWGGSIPAGVTGQVNVVATSGATLYITGVQLEVGTVATPFERRLYGQELALCQRYYYRLSPANATAWLGMGISQTGTTATIMSPLPVTMRAAPTALEQTGTATDYRIIVSSYITCSAVPVFYQATQYAVQTTFTVAAITANLPVAAYTNSTSAYLGWSAEL